MRIIIFLNSFALCYDTGTEAFATFVFSIQRMSNVSYIFFFLKNINIIGTISFRIIYKTINSSILTFKIHLIYCSWQSHTTLKLILTCLSKLISNNYLSW